LRASRYRADAAETRPALISISAEPKRAPTSFGHDESTAEKTR
jgi:hypothetical protein